MTRKRSGFGGHLAGLREARGLTQEVLAEKCGVSADTIGRLERNGFSPSLDTLRKLAEGLDLRLSTLFEAYELGDRDRMREMTDLLASRPDADVVFVTELVRVVLRELDARRTGESDDDGE